MRFTALFLANCLICTAAMAQPDVHWAHMYGAERRDIFNDVYASSDGGYAACGSHRDLNHSPDSTYDAWVVKVDEIGNVEWQVELGNAGLADEAVAIIETDFREFLTVGKNEGRVFAWMIDPDGEVMWSRSYAEGKAYAVIELKSGQYVIAGRGDRQYYMVCFLHDDGEVVWEHTYADGASSATFETLKETQGGIVAAGEGYYDGIPYWRAGITKVEFNGDRIWQRQLNPQPCQMCHSLVSRPGGFAMLGEFWTGDGRQDFDFAFIEVDDEGNQESFRRIDVDNNSNDRGYGLVRLNPDGYVLTGTNGNTATGQAVAIDPQLNTRWTVIYNRMDRIIQGVCGTGNSFQNATIAPDGAVMVCGSVQPVQGNSNGLIMKLQQEILSPQFLYWEPEDTILTVLQHDTLDFLVRATGPHGMDLNYFWLFCGDTISHDTTATVIFDSLGVFELPCVVYGGGFTASITWHITVDDFFIRWFSPDSTDLVVRRNTTIPFSTNIACADREAITTCVWTYIDRNLRRNPLGEGDSVDVCFDLAGDCAVEALAEWGPQRDQVRWNAAVRSAVWWWNPHVDSLTAHQGDTQEFNIIPFNRDSDSLSYEWRLDDIVLGVEEDLLELEFPALGEYVLTAVCHDGAEADTIGWLVTVIERSEAPFVETDLPTTLTLYPPVPNPFNNQTRIDYYLDKEGWVSLKVYDIRGRLVVDLVDQVDSGGRHSVVLDASGLAAGVYVAALRGEGATLKQKVVVIK